MPCSKRFRLPWMAFLIWSPATILLGAGQRGNSELQIELAKQTPVSPGETIKVKVTSPGGANFAQVILAGESPLPAFSDAAQDVPCEISISVSADAQPGKHKLRAIGTTDEGRVVESEAVLVDVETSDNPILLTADPALIAFDSQGQQRSMRILGTYADGRLVDVTESSKVHYTSSDPAVVTVDGPGLVTGRRTGDADITLLYRVESGPSPRISVPVTVPAASITWSPASLSFGPESVGGASPVELVRLGYHGTGDLEILGVVISGGDFSETDDCVSSSPLLAGSVCTIYVTFTPAAGGEKTGSLTINNSTSPVKIPLSGTAIGEEAETPPSPLALED